MKGDKVDAQAVSAFFEKTYSDDPEKLEKAAEAVGKCATLGESEHYDWRSGPQVRFSQRYVCQSDAHNCQENNCWAVNLVYLFDVDDQIEDWILSPLDKMLLKKAPDHQIGEENL